MRHNKRKVTMFLVDKIVLYLGIFLSVLTAQDYKVITQQVSLSQSPMTSDSLVLQGSLGKNFHQTGSGDTQRRPVEHCIRDLFPSSNYENYLS